MLAENLKVGGAVVFWSCAKNTRRSDVAIGLDGLGLREYVPEPRTPMGCLRAALDEAYPAPSKKVRHVIRPIPSGFAVVAETPEDAQAGQTWGDTVATATIDDKENTIDLKPYDWDKLDALRDSMKGAAQWLPAASVGKALVRLIEHFGGVCVRPAGGVYWLNDEHLERFEKVASVFETASSDRANEGEEVKLNQVNVLRVVADEQMVRAVGDALVAEIESELAKIQDDVAGEISEHACDNRLRKVGKLLDKVKRYEEAFGKPMTSLSDSVGKTMTLVAMASLQASAAHNPDQQRMAFCS